MNTLFISYASDDQAIALEVCAQLEAQGVRCWIAPRDVAPGAKWDEAIVDAIQGSGAFLLILTAAANESPYVGNEVNHAFAAKKAIFTFRVEDVQPNKSIGFYLARHHWTDGFPPPLEAKVAQLAAGVSGLLGVGDAGAGAGTAAPTGPAARPAVRSARRTVWQRMPRRERMAWVATGASALVAFLALVFLVVALPGRGAAAVDTGPVWLELTTPPSGTPEAVALSPDGRQIVFTAETPDGQEMLFLRALDTPEAQPIPGTEGARTPVWSPDGRSLAFVEGARLKRVEIAGGAPQVLAGNITNAVGNSWSQDGVLLFSINRGTGLSGILRVSATGGEPVSISTPTGNEGSHNRAMFLPDGQRFLYRVSGGAQPGIYLAALDGSDRRFLVDADEAVYAPPGFLLFVRGETLYAQSFDADAYRLSGSAVPLAQQVAQAAQLVLSGGRVSVGANSAVAFRRGSEAAQRRLEWFDRAGSRLGRLASPDVADPQQVALSPDGRQVAFARNVAQNPDIWVFDLARETASKFTLDAAADTAPIWSRDGARIAFGSTRGKNVYNIYQKLVGAAGSDELLVESLASGFPQDWSPDGRYLLYRLVDAKTDRDLWAVALDGSADRRPFPVVNTPSADYDGQFSPDGRWIAYASTVSGRPEIYLQPFPKATERWQVSTAGGNEALWRRDGRELFYVAPDGTIVAVPITLGADGRRPDLGTPRPLFKSAITAMGRGGIGSGHQYAVTPDGQRFLIIVQGEEISTAPITLLLNWTAALEQ